MSKNFNNDSNLNDNDNNNNNNTKNDEKNIMSNDNDSNNNNNDDTIQFLNEFNFPNYDGLDEYRGGNLLICPNILDPFQNLNLNFENCHVMENNFCFDNNFQMKKMEPSIEKLTEKIPIEQESSIQSLPKLLNKNFVVGILIEISLSCSLIEKYVEEIFDIFIEEKFVDWWLNNEYSYEGRIYGSQEESQFTCEIYRCEEENKYALELNRMNGDGFLFLKFVKKFSNEWNKKIGLEENNENEDSNNNNIEDDENFKKINKDIKLSKSDAIKYINDTKISMVDGEIWRNNVLRLRSFVNDNDNAKSFAEVEDIFNQLLAPIQNNENPILDCFIIKNLLETILELIPFTKFAFIDNIQDISKKWKDFVEHPFGIMLFGPSQQICRVCSKIIQSANK